MNILIFITILLAIVATAIFISVGIEDRGTISVVADILAAISVVVIIIALMTYAYLKLSAIIASWMIM